VTQTHSILDLPISEVEKIELEIGLPVGRWGEAPSMAALYVAIIAAIEGRPRSEYASMTLRQLSDRVAFGDVEQDRPQPSAP
jgi:hypothetical protein